MNGAISFCRRGVAQITKHLVHKLNPNPMGEQSFPLSYDNVVLLVRKVQPSLEPAQVFWIQCFLVVFCFAYGVILGINSWALYRSEKHIMCVRRHIRFLDALWREFNQVGRSLEEIKKKAKQVGGGSEKSLEEATRLLKDKEDFVKTTQSVSGDAERHVRVYESLAAERSFLSSFVADFVNLRSSLSNARHMERTVEKINDHLLMSKEQIREMCKLLEQLRNRVRRLQDRPIGKTENTILGKKRRQSSAVSLALEQLSTGKRSLIQGRLAEELRVTEMKVKLVEEFVNDLRWVKLESEIEKAWVDEAIGVIEDADRYVFAVSEKEEKIERWPVALGIRNWWAKRDLMKRIDSYNREYSDLLEEKTRYGIQFIRRDSPKQLRRNHYLIDDRSIRSSIEIIREKLRSGDADSSTKSRVNSLCKQVEHMVELLKDKEGEGAMNARSACFNLLLDTTKKLHNWVIEGMKETMPGLVDEITQFENVVKLLEKMVGVYNIKVLKESCQVVGLEEDVHELVTVLTATTATPSEEGERDLRVVAVVGTQGIGKTTLANEILNNASICKHFTTRSLVQFKLEDRLSNELVLLQEVGWKILPGRDRLEEEGLWISKISNFLKDNACLLVLDDLPSTNVWDKLKKAFPEKCSKSVIMLTTRSTEVALHARPSKTHRLRLRTGEESWEFFTQMVKLPSSQLPSKDEDKITPLAKDVVARTGGLPLAILNLGYLFSGKALTEEDLSSMLEGTDISQNIWSETWNINKKDFQSRSVLGKCYSYCEFFPKDYKIPSRRLVALWAASKSVKSKEISNEKSKPVDGDEDDHEGKKYESAASNYLQELVDRNMIQVVERKRNGKIKTCRFPSTLREIWLQDKLKESARAREWSLYASFDQQLAYRFDDHEASSARRNHGLNSDTVSHEEKYPISIMFFDTRDGKKPGEDIGNFLQKGIASTHRRFQDLLVLDLEGVFMPHLPSSIGKLQKLTYLGLRWTCLETLPKSIGDLSCLQSLDLKHTYVRKLPPSIQKLKMLRQLYLNQRCRIQLTPQLAGSMKNLQTLSGVFLDHADTIFPNALEKFQNLQKLGITMSQLQKQQQKALVKGIMKLSQLRSLSLISINEKGEPQDLYKLKSLSDLTNLTSLYLLGKLENQSLLDNLPLSLIELTLSASELKENPVPKLQKLGKLQFLSFLSDSYLGNHMVFCKEDLKNLLVIRIWSLPSLEKLEMEEGALQKLREFEIRCCKKLKFTAGFTLLKTLQVLKLTNMPDEDLIEQEYFEAAKKNSSEIIVHRPSIVISQRKLIQRQAKETDTQRINLDVTGH